jgi:hypothetical protein
MAEAAVADLQRTLAKLVHYRPDDTRAGQYHLGALELLRRVRGQIRKRRGGANLYVAQ